MSKTHWFDLTARDFEKLDKDRTIAILPIAATEQHGPHLSVGTDTLMAGGFCAEVKKRLPNGLSVLFLPVFWVGKSNEHLRSPGTITLSAETLIRAWTEIGESVARAGARKLIIANSHGGNVPVMDIVARDLRVKHGMLVVQCSWHRLGSPAGLFSEAETMHGIHGGEIETSQMLHLRRDLVHMAKARDFASAAIIMEQRYRHLRATQRIAFGWASEDLHPSGAIGNAAASTPAAGRQQTEFTAKAFVELLEDVHAFPVDRLGTGVLA